MSRIRFGTVIESEPPEEQIPPGFLNGDRGHLLRQWEREHTLVFCQRAAYNQMHSHARSDRHHECTGLLVGQVFRDPKVGRTFVVIERTVPVDAASQSGVHVHVDVERFNRAQSEIQKQMPGYVLVGWYHTHPNLGIFLSGVDHQVTKGLFNASWHVATVIDPVRNEEGSFTEQGNRQISGMVQVQQPTPITELMALYRTSLELLDRRALPQARERLDQLDRFYQQATTASDRGDLELWIQRGGYRDLAQLIERAMATTQPDSSSDIATADVATVEVSPAEADPAEHTTRQSNSLGDAGLSQSCIWSHTAEQQLQDLARGQAKLAQQLQQIEPSTGAPSSPRFILNGLLGLLLGLVISGLLGVELYLQQIQTQAIQEQNQLLMTVVAQNSTMGQNRRGLAQSPPPTVTRSPVRDLANVPAPADRLAPFPMRPR